MNALPSAAPLSSRLEVQSRKGWSSEGTREGDSSSCVCSLTVVDTQKAFTRTATVVRTLGSVVTFQDSCNLNFGALKSSAAATTLQRLPPFQLQTTSTIEGM
ncbi:unnamed protein product [Calypogeia fissa]